MNSRLLAGKPPVGRRAFAAPARRPVGRSERAFTSPVWPAGRLNCQQTAFLPAEGLPANRRPSFTFLWAEPAVTSRRIPTELRCHRAREILTSSYGSVAA